MMFKLSIKDWDNIYDKFKGELTEKIIEKKTELKQDQNNIKNQSACMALNDLYVEEATLNELNDSIRSVMNDKASMDDERRIPVRKVKNAIYELDAELEKENSRYYNIIHDKSSNELSGGLTEYCFMIRANAYARERLKELREKIGEM